MSIYSSKIVAIQPVDSPSNLEKSIETMFRQWRPGEVSLGTILRNFYTRYHHQHIQGNWFKDEPKTEFLNALYDTVQSFYDVDMRSKSCYPGMTGKIKVTNHLIFIEKNLIGEFPLAIPEKKNSPYPDSEETGWRNPAELRSKLKLEDWISPLLNVG